MALPKCFCWTRFGTEAGQTIEQILARKEQERIANKGVFFWGIGNALGPSIDELVRNCKEPQVLFSPIKSPARSVDVAPSALAAWTTAETLRGEEFRLPSRSLITSRHDPSAPRRSHYALVCFSELPLTSKVANFTEKLAFRSLRNLRTGRALGASQVTAIVRRSDVNLVGTTYQVAFSARLVPPYFIRLRDPMLLSPAEQVLDWADVVRMLWDRQIPRSVRQGTLRLPF